MVQNKATNKNYVILNMKPNLQYVHIQTKSTPTRDCRYADLCALCAHLFCVFKMSFNLF